MRVLIRHLLLAVFFIQTVSIAADSAADSGIDKDSWPGHDPFDDSRFDDSWFEDTPEEKSLAVNEGDLTFIAPVTDKPTLNSIIRLTIDDSSLNDGWVKLSQCYKNINPVSSTDIVYQYRQLRQLKLVSQHLIDKVEIAEQVIHLTGVSPGAALCITAEVNILEKQAPGAGQRPRYKLSSGPYHLRFFDGYYPFQLTLSIEYPSQQINIVNLSPAPEPLFEVKNKAGLLSFDSWFEGELTLQVEFERTGDNGPDQDTEKRFQ